MRCIVVGLGIQGRKRLGIAGADAVATVDPVAGGARFKTVAEVPLDSYDAALVCTPDQAKVDVLSHLLGHGKHVLVEKPLLASDGQFRRLQELAQTTGAVCYTAYNHRFEPHLARVRELLETRALGKVYLARFHYGNGTARDVRGSPWRDQGLGVLSDLGSHLFDLTLFLFGKPEGALALWGTHCFENRALDHCLFGFHGTPFLEMEVSLIAWRNSFSLDVFGDEGSLHVQGLCKWGPSTLTARRRILPSGKPTEEAQVLECPDPTWSAEYQYFKQLCRSGGTNIAHDIWISSVLTESAQRLGKGLAA